MMYFFKTILFIFLLNFSIQVFSQTKVTASIDAAAKTASMSNGIITLSVNSKGQVSSLIYKEKDLISSSAGGKFYFSYNDISTYYELSPTTLSIKEQSDDYAEVVYSKTSGQLVIEQAFILRKDVSGIYCYVTVKGTSTPVNLREMRMVYRVNPSLFTYGYVSDKMQGALPSVAVMAAVNDTPVMDATYQLPDGSIYTKYDWTNYIVDDSVHGIMSDTEGVWAIPVSHEYVNGGPMKQELTVHATNKTPLVLQMLQGEHLGSSSQNYVSGDEKIYGPFFIYVNSGTNHNEMIEDAKQQASIQKAQWPFQWLNHSLYPTKRTTVKGQINLHAGLSPDGIQVVLAQPGTDIYAQGKQYLFWTKCDRDGNFSIRNVRAGNYALYAYATKGEITDEFVLNNVKAEGETVDLGPIEWRPKKYENLLWRIGDNDRMTSGFHYADTIRRYGLYNLPPANLTYTIGTSRPESDWYYAQTKAGSWSVTFNNDRTYSGNAILTASIAGAANSPTVTVYVNGSNKGSWSFTNDGSIYRSAVLSGRHLLKTLTFPASLLVKGSNTIKLTMSNPGNRGGVMYDCLKLETGALLTGIDDEYKEARASGLAVSVFPNPVRYEAAVELFLPENDRLSIQIINAQGRPIASLYEGTLSAGPHHFIWQAGSQPAGIYHCRVTTSSTAVSCKIMKTN